MIKKKIIALNGEIRTTYYGYRKLVSFYKEALKFQDEKISINLYSLTWIDANMGALLAAIMDKLRKERGLKFSTDFGFVETYFDVLLRNGVFIKVGDKKKDDFRESTVELKRFKKSHDKEFMSYISHDLFEHRGLRTIDDKYKEEIIDQMIEVFTNFEQHAKTDYPIYVCGQYYPRKKNLNFSMVDLGIGFLPTIKSYTKGSITNNLDAIRWAIERGNTTKIGEPGGSGLYNLQKYFREENGHVDIISGDIYWSTKKDIGTKIGTGKTLEDSFVGSAINLCFSC